MSSARPLTEDQVAVFIAAHRLPARFRDTIERHYLPLATWLQAQKPPARPLLLGINGGQGTGKSTLAAFLKLALESMRGWRVAVLSIDDFYLTRAERARLAERVHPLLATRGAPGTHDVGMLSECLAALRRLGAGETLALPRFDKAEDERAARQSWPLVRGPVDLIILEGWCVGSVAEPDAALDEPVNALERDADRDGRWRRYVNERLGAEYAGVFAGLDALVFLKIPDFDAVYRWRLEQEQKLADARGGAGQGIMTAEQIATFIQHYERVTRGNLRAIPAIADVPRAVSGLL